MASILKNVFKKNFMGTASERSNRERLVRQDSERRARQRTMLTLLESINLNDPLNKLPEEAIRELKIAEAIRFACNRLLAVNHFYPDAPTLDQNITHIIKALHEAIRRGFVKTAEWACAALVYCLRELWTEILYADSEYADALVESRVWYSKDLLLLVAMYREYDRITENLKEMNQDKAYLEARLNDAAGKPDDLLRLINAIKNLRHSIEEMHHMLNARADAIETLCSSLTIPPLFSDPKLRYRYPEALNSTPAFCTKSDESNPDATGFIHRPSRSLLEDLPSIDNL